MRNRRPSLLLLLLLVLSLLVTACAPRPGAGELAATASASDLVVDLPAIAVSFDEAGQASVLGMSLADLGGMLGTDLSAVSLPPDMVQRLTAAGIQNVFVNVTKTGLQFYVNGKQMPSFQWDDASLAATADLMGLLDARNLDLLKQILPVLGKLSMGIVLKFPGAGEELPLTSEPDLAALQAAQDQAVAGLGMMGGLLQALPPLTIAFDANGDFQIQGLAPFILAQIPPGTLDPLKQSPETIASVSEMGIDTVNVQTTPEGLVLTINGLTLPTITWGSGEIENLVGILVDSGVLAAIQGKDDPALAGTLNQVRQFAAIARAAKLNLTLTFP